jgi:M6 family metalloprotease-like protein
MDTLGFLAPDSGLFYDPPHFKRYFERQMEGLRNYFRAQSLGKLWVDYTVMPEGDKDAYQLPRDMVFYGDTTSYEAIELGLVRLMRDAFKAADLDPAINFADYDEFIIFHAGSGLQSDFGLARNSPFDLLAGEIPAGAIQAYLGEPYILVDSGRTRIEQATVLPEMMRQDTMYNGFTNILGMTGLAGTLCHEFAHLLGSYDLYDVTGVTMGVGGWSLQGYGGWLGDYGAGAPPGVIPGFCDAYHRVALGFVNPVVVNQPRDRVLVYAAQMDTGLFAQRSDTTHPTIIKIPISAQEYFLIENRQVDVTQPDTIDVDVEDGVVIAIGGNEYDFFQPGSGILVWHVDERILADYGPYNAVNIFPERKGVDLEEADGVQDFDVPYWQSRDFEYEVYGYKYDAFVKGGYNDRFTFETNPNTDGYTGKSYISIALQGEADSTRPLKDTVIAVSVDWDLYQAGFPQQGGGMPFLSACAVDLDGNDSLEIVVSDTAGRVRVWRADGRPYSTRWPGSSFGSTVAPPAVGDVNGDGRAEIVIANATGRVRVYPDSGGASLAAMAAADRIISTPVLADLDGDGAKDIIVGATDMKLYAWHGNGQPLAGFPVSIGTEVRAPVAVTDTVRGQIVVLTGDSRVLLVNPDGTVAPGFPVTLGISPFYPTAQPLVADFNRDGAKEIAVIAPGDFEYRVSLLSLGGEVLHRSREFIRHPFYGTPAAVDMDADGKPDVLAASMNELFAVNYNGSPVTGFPFRRDSTYEVQELAGNWIITYDVYFSYLSSPTVADVDGDGSAELVIGSPQYGVLALDGRTGKLLDRFPLMTTASVSAVPLVADLDRDGDVELAVGSDSGLFYVWDLPGPATGVKWGCAYHDPCHTGLIPDSELPAAPTPMSDLAAGYYVYPNPAGNNVNVRYKLGADASAVKLTFLNLAGEPVMPDVQGQALAGVDNETTVGLTGIAAGLYVVRLEVEGGGRREVKFAKLAVVR